VTTNPLQTCVISLSLETWCLLQKSSPLRDVLETKLCKKVCQWLAAGQWYSLCTPVSSTNKIDRHDINESGEKHHNVNTNSVKRGACVRGQVVNIVDIMITSLPPPPPPHWRETGVSSRPATYLRCEGSRQTAHDLS
jgi:hypothetical protein